MKTRSIKVGELEENWYVVDAQGHRLGKLATKVAALLNGKHDVSRVGYLAPKHKVIVVNSKEVDLHPRKVINKKYYSHSGYPGGFKEVNYERMHDQKPNRVIELAVKGMLPKTKHQDIMLRNLFVYEGPDHNHEAQKPKEIEI